MNMKINSISNNIETIANNKNLSMNLISTSTSILKSCETRIKKSILIFLAKIYYFFNLIRIYQCFYNYDSYRSYLGSRTLQEKLKLITERTLSETENINSLHEMSFYLYNQKSILVNNITELNVNISNKITNVWEYCKPMNDKIYIKLNSLTSEFNNAKAKYGKEENQTWFDIWKRKIDEELKNIENEWINYFNITDSKNITAFCSSDQDASINTTGITIIFSMCFFILGMVLLYFLFKRTSIGYKLGFRRSNNTGIPENIEER